MSNRPLCIDLYAGLGGWAEGFLAEGYDVVGFDIERHDYGTGGYPGALALQDVLTIHGSQFKDATVIVASPPCQEYSYMAMPWSRAKAIAREYRSGERDVKQLTALFDACFRIQREASEAAAHYVPLIVENVRGAQPWVGRSRWHYGSFHLWGDVPALMPFSRGTKMPPHINESTRQGKSPARWTNPAEHYVGRKVPGMDWSKFGTEGYKPQGFNVTAAQNYREGLRQGGDWFSTEGSISRTTGSKSDSRRAASAQIAKIPFPLARWIAKCFRPD